jgi:hypothetical protein
MRSSARTNAQNAEKGPSQRRQASTIEAIRASVASSSHLNFVVIFGPTNVKPAVAALESRGWIQVVATDGRGKPKVATAPRIQFDLARRHFIVLPHPSAMGGALKKALDFLDPGLNRRLSPVPVGSRVRRTRRMRS